MPSTPLQRQTLIALWCIVILLLALLGTLFMGKFVLHFQIENCKLSRDYGDEPLFIFYDDEEDRRYQFDCINPL